MSRNKLSICIPTYNRPEKLIKQAIFLVNEVANLLDPNQVEIIIRDNHSDILGYDSMAQRLQGSGIKFHRNDVNIGLVGNLNALLQEATGEYVWFVGDDDILHEGIVKKVYEKCIDIGLVFINHRAVDEQGKVKLKEAFNKHTQKSIHHVFRYSGTTMMFITACVYKRELLEEVFSTSELQLSLPFKTSLYCAEKGGVVYIDDILIDNYWGEVSWGDSSKDIFLRQVPMDLIASLHFSVSKVNALHSLVRYLSSNYKRMIKYAFKKYVAKHL